MTQRNQSLQGVRGIAVCLILAGHFHSSLLSSCAPGSLLYPLSRLLAWVMAAFPTALGTTPVIMFLVLSGYVTHPVFAARSAGWRYVARRWLRFWPTLAATTAATVLVLAFLPASNAGPWLNWGYTEIDQVTVRSVVQQLVLVGPIDTRSFNPPVWYLVHAARIWLLVPLVVLLVAGRSPRVLAAGMAALVSGAILFRLIPHPSLDLGLGYTAVYAIPFAFGVVAAEVREGLDTKLAGWPKWVMAVVTLFAVLVATGVGTGSGWAPQGLSAIAARYWFIQIILIGAASAWLVLGLLRSTIAERALIATGAVAVGAISYSVYMWQYLAMRTTASLLNGRVGGSLVAVVAFGAVWVLALIGFALVERPSMKLSARFRAAIGVFGAGCQVATAREDPSPIAGEGGAANERRSTP